MAVYRKSYKSKVYKKKTVSKPKVSTAVKKYVKRQMLPVKPEVKRYVDYLAEDTITTSGTLFLPYEFITTQGLGPSLRVGTSCRLIGLHMNTVIRNNSNQTNLFRVVIVSCDGSTETSSGTGELFQDGNNSGNPASISQNAGLKLMTAEINRVKFKVHYDHKFKLGASTATDSSDVKTFTHFHKFNSVVKYEANLNGLLNQNRRFLIFYFASEGKDDLDLTSSIEVSGTHKWFFTDV